MVINGLTQYFQSTGSPDVKHEVSTVLNIIKGQRHKKTTNGIEIRHKNEIDDST